LAVSNAHFELAAMLLDMGADPNAAGQGWAALHAVTWVRKLGGGDNGPAPQGSGKMSSLDFVRVLKAKGVNLNARMTTRKRVGASVLNTNGATPFLLACKSDDAELMRLLAELGADPKLPNSENSTPLMVAAGLGTRSPGEDAGTEPEALEAVQLALELGNDINAVDSNGETAMHGAAYKQFPLVAQFLADHGAKIEIWNRKDKSGWTPLRIAAGVFRTANFRFSDPTAEALRRIMRAAGVSTDLEPTPETDGLNRGALPQQK
jgi:ankyrin repeat protein